MSNTPTKIIEYKNGDKEGVRVSVEGFGKKERLENTKTTAEIRQLILDLQKENE